MFKAISLLILFASIAVFVLLSKVGVSDLALIFEKSDTELKIYLGFVLFVNVVAAITSLHIWSKADGIKKKADK